MTLALWTILTGKHLFNLGIVLLLALFASLLDRLGLLLAFGLLINGTLDGLEDPVKLSIGHPRLIRRFFLEYEDLLFKPVSGFLINHGCFLVRLLL